MTNTTAALRRCMPGVHDLVQGICGEGDCYPNFEFGLQNQRVLSAIEASMVSRRWVNVVKD